MLTHVITAGTTCDGSHDASLYRNPGRGLDAGRHRLFLVASLGERGLHNDLIVEFHHLGLIRIVFDIRVFDIRIVDIRVVDHVPAERPDVL